MPISLQLAQLAGEPILIDYKMLSFRGPVFSRVHLELPAFTQALCTFGLVGQATDTVSRFILSGISQNIKSPKDKAELFLTDSLKTALVFRGSTHHLTLYNHHRSSKCTTHHASLFIIVSAPCLPVYSDISTHTSLLIVVSVPLPPCL